MFRYPAFLSYSRRDLEFARKLHGQLEAYRIPRSAGYSEHSEKGDRISPVFRDQDEVSASPNLGDTLTGALADSSALIVIASPDAAESKWVNAEIEQFARLGRANRIFVAIPDYIPTDRHYDIRQIFPPALLSLGEPLAADFRKTCDGWTLAKLKLVAGVAGIDLVRLRDRDAARRLRNGVIGTGAAIAVAGVVGYFGWSALDAQNRERVARVERSLDGVRTALLADQPGNALAFLDTLAEGDVSEETRAALDRVRLFWADGLVSPRARLAALPLGAKVSIGNVLYFRTATGVTPLPPNAWKVRQSRVSGLIFEEESGALSRLDPASGALTPLLTNPPADIGTLMSEVYERPDGTLIAVWTGGGEGSVGGSYGVAMVVYPDGSNSGVLQNMVFTDFHANADCTKIYFADGSKGYGRATAGSPDPATTQALYSGPSESSEYSRDPNRPSTLNVTTLTRGDGWRENEVARDTSLDFETFGFDWVGQQGPALRDACASYLLESTHLGQGEAEALSTASNGGRGLTRDNSVSDSRLWSAQRWVDQSLFGDNMPEFRAANTPKYMTISGSDRFAIWSDHFTGAHTTHLISMVCAQIGPSGAQCREFNSADDYGLIILPHARLIAAGGEIGMINLTSMQAMPWPGGGMDQLAADSADGRTILTLTPAGQLSVLSYEGGALNVVRSFDDANWADGQGLAVLRDGDALLLTLDGRLTRIDSETGEAVWSMRDRALAGELAGDIDDVGHHALIALSPNGHYAAVTTASGLRLYETTIGAPLSPFHRYAERGARSGLTQNVHVAIGDDGAVSVGSRTLGFVRAAPQAAASQGEDLVCLYGARIADGRPVAVDVFGDPEMRSRCGLDNLGPPPG